MVAIVDDDDDVREALSDLILALGLSCRAYDRAEALLAAYEPDVFDCVITDLWMPGMSGLELLRQLRRMDGSLPVIVITSDANPETRTQALAAGAHACVAKPVADSVLLGHLQSALGRDDLLAGGCERTGTPDG
ncbi:MAG: response regulator transcription factor [Hyphomicrobiaceae bacterium]